MAAAMNWLLGADPAIRWQALQDLAHASADVVAIERARVAFEGWGASLLALQLPNGQWGAGEDRGWMTTIHTLVVLMALGVDPHSAPARAAIARVQAHISWWQLDGRPFFDGETEPCLNGGILAVGAYFGHASAVLVARLLAEQLADGGWNCEAPASARASFHTTICVLEGLWAYEQAQGATPAVTQARGRAHDYLLERRMFRSLSSGAVIDRRWERFAFPPTWHYDLLRGLDYLRSAGVAPDERVDEAVAIVEKRRHQNGRWPLNHLHADRIAFDMEPGVGRASRWNTLRALRVLAWHAAGRVA